MPLPGAFEPLLATAEDWLPHADPEPLLAKNVFDRLVKVFTPQTVDSDLHDLFFITLPLTLCARRWQCQLTRQTGIITPAWPFWLLPSPCWHFDTWHFDTGTLWHPTFWHPDILTTRHFVNQTLCHPDIVPLRTNLDILTPRHFATQTFCHTSHFDTQTFGNRSALSYSNNYPNSCNLGTAHTGWPSTITVQRLAFWLNESLIRSDRISIH